MWYCLYFGLLCILLFQNETRIEVQGIELKHQTIVNNLDTKKIKYNHENKFKFGGIQLMDSLKYFQKILENIDFKWFPNIGKISFFSLIGTFYRS